MDDLSKINGMFIWSKCFGDEVDLQRLVMELRGDVPLTKEARNNLADLLENVRLKPNSGMKIKPKRNKSPYKSDSFEVRIAKGEFYLTCVHIEKILDTLDERGVEPIHQGVKNKEAALYWTIDCFEPWLAQAGSVRDDFGDIKDGVIKVAEAWRREGKKLGFDTDELLNDVDQMTTNELKEFFEI